MPWRVTSSVAIGADLPGAHSVPPITKRLRRTMAAAVRVFDRITLGVLVAAIRVGSEEGLGQEEHRERVPKDPHLAVDCRIREFRGKGHIASLAFGQLPGPDHVDDPLAFLLWRGRDTSERGPRDDDG